MVNYTLEDLAADPKSVEGLFEYHTRNNRYGCDAALAIILPERIRLYPQRLQVAAARTTFERERTDPTTNDILMRTYLPTYSQERNQSNWNRGKNIAIGMGVTGLAFLVWSVVSDAEVAKKAGKVAGAVFEIGAGLRLLRDYFRYKT